MSFLSSKKFISAVLTIGVVAVGFIIPPPDGLSVAAWHLFAIFLGTVVGFILQPIELGTIALIALVLCALTGVMKFSQVLSAFSGNTVWLIVSAFLLARAFIITGLGRRIAYLAMRAFGDSSLKLVYSLALSDVIIGPAIPSNSARAGGLIFPIVQSLAHAFDSKADESPRRLGAYLMACIFHLDLVVSALFLTAMVGNPIAVAMAKKVFDIDITWIGWFVAASVPGIAALIIIPYVLYKFYPPEIKKTPEAKNIANKALEEMGPMCIREKILLFVFVMLLILWATTTITHLDTTLIAFMGLCILLIGRVLTWKDVISEKKAWDTLIWVGGVIVMSDYLNKLGFIPWFAAILENQMIGVSMITAVVLSFIIYLYSHYFFASMSAHVTAMYAALITLGAAAGAPPFISAFVVAIAANICGCLTHFGTGPAPVYFGAGYIDQKTWWTIGFGVSVMHIIIWLGIGGVWWKVLGYW
ncbi:DASS family sodium-coupled anion symporter [Pectinatus haikarae]|uniref:DASS family divalent anion:Na+ symporter n=1 Tax=Pectinatus haikarae TaxID=349096 RepID=A0ABT9Y746_9FIRM|nr:DASS family sodium-coupled anion symporter [Pectinatus haikarae]MDQ0203658.1 DASS family divalent anion:Na+ symporter [Pectinatus haikarae]